MNTKNIVLSAGLLVAGAACLAFGSPRSSAASSPTSVPVVAKVTQPAQTTPAQVGPQAESRDIEHSHMMAPAFLTLEQGDTDPVSGDTEYFAHVDVRDSINYPVSIEIKLAKGQQLTAGTLKEQIDLSGALNSRVSRSFKIHGVANAQNPVQVHVGGQSAGAVVGFYADKMYPPRAPLAVDRPNGPRPPEGRPPVAKPAFNGIARLPGQLAQTTPCESDDSRKISADVRSAEIFCFVFSMKRETLGNR